MLVKVDVEVAKALLGWVIDRRRELVGVNVDDAPAMLVTVCEGVLLVERPLSLEMAVVWRALRAPGRCMIARRRRAQVVEDDYTEVDVVSSSAIQNPDLQPTDADVVFVVPIADGPRIE